jgi:phosphoribosylaminoimidazole-succinocarboxamide synthase
VASDRLSAFDVVLDEPIPYKGEVLTKVALFWFDLLKDVAPNHLISADVADLPPEFQEHADYRVRD